MKNLFWLFLCVLLSLIMSCTKDDASQQFTINKLGTDISKNIDNLFSHLSDTTPGCALSIIQNGEIVYSKGYGSADLEHHLPITPQSVFYIGSVSKQFVTFSILLLEEQGLLSLDDNVRKYI